MQCDILTDVESGIWLEHFENLGRDAAGGADAVNWSIRKRTLRGGLSDGVDVVAVDNGQLRFELLPTRGMGLWRGQCQGSQLGWQSPVRFPVHPKMVNLAARGGFGWLDGFQEWMCRCGLDSFGSPEIDTAAAEKSVTLHGRIANLPAHYVAAEVDDASPRNLMIRGVVEEASLFGPKLRLDTLTQTEVGSPRLEIIDEVTNLSDEPGEMQILYHANFGPPLLEPGSRIVTSFDEIAPYDDHAATGIDDWDACSSGTPGFVEQCYFFRPRPIVDRRAQVLLRNATGDRAACLSFDVGELPCLTLWKYLAGPGDGYVVGLEPSSNFPNPKSFEQQQGRVVALTPGQSRRASLRFEYLGDCAAIADLEKAIRDSQAERAPEVHRTPRPEYTPAS